MAQWLTFTYLYALSRSRWFKPYKLTLMRGQRREIHFVAEIKSRLLLCEQKLSLMMVLYKHRDVGTGSNPDWPFALCGPGERNDNSIFLTLPLADSQVLVRRAKSIALDENTLLDLSCWPRSPKRRKQKKRGLHCPATPQRLTITAHLDLTAWQSGAHHLHDQCVDIVTVRDSGACKCKLAAFKMLIYSVVSGPSIVQLR